MSIRKAVRITTLVDNTPGITGTSGEHGLSFLLETDSWRILFDTGAGAVLENNAQVLGVSLSDLDAIVLSHGHYDHTGGLAVACQASPNAPVVLHPDALAPKYSRNEDGSTRYIGMPTASRALCRHSESALLPVTRPTAIVEGVFATGEIPCRSEVESGDTRYYLDEAHTHSDPFLDDQALYFNSARGTVVVLGCAHRGVMNTLCYVRQLTGNRPLHAVLGGMHLSHASVDRIASTVAYLAGSGLDEIGIAHCTGQHAEKVFRAAFPEQCRSCNVGTVMQFEIDQE